MWVLITGCMFAGKSSELLTRLRRDAVAGKKCVLVCHASDRRYTQRDEVVTHNGTRMQALRAERIADVMDQLRDADTVGIDEGQFFPDIHLLGELGADKHVAVAALMHQFTGKPFPLIASSMHLWDDIVYLHAVCWRCKAYTASRTVRLTPVDDTLVGGAEAYAAACKLCFTATSSTY
jgi:thymidine kinase